MVPNAFLFRKVQSVPRFTKVCLPLHATCLRLLAGMELGPGLLTAPPFLTSLFTASQATLPSQVSPVTP